MDNFKVSKVCSLRLESQRLSVDRIFLSYAALNLKEQGKFIKDNDIAIGDINRFYSAISPCDDCVPIMKKLMSVDYYYSFKFVRGNQPHKDAVNDLFKTIK